MNESDIEQLNPSKEMSDLVAIEVMKWRREDDHWVTPEGFWVAADGLEGWHPWQYPAWGIWQVIEELRKDFWCIEINIADSCFVKAELLKTPPIEIRVDSQDGIKGLPAAICRLALLTTIKRK